MNEHDDDHISRLMMTSQEDFEMTDKYTSERIDLTQAVPIIFANVITPKAIVVKGKTLGEPKYSVDFQFEPDSADLAMLVKEMQKVMTAKWPGRDFKTNPVAKPFKDGNKLADKAKAKDKNREFDRGKILLSARTAHAPDLGLIANGSYTEFAGELRAKAAAHFYTGVKAYGTVMFNAYSVGEDESLKEGVNCYFSAVVSTGEGKRLVGGPSAKERFKGYVGKVSAIDPTDDEDDSPY